MASWHEDQYQTDEKLKVRIALHQQYNTNSQSWTEWVREQLPMQPGSRVLDLGCGPGELWFVTPVPLPEHTSLLLADRSMGMLRSARCSLNAMNLPYMCCDAMQTPLAAGRFDLVLANHCLFLLPEIPAALQEIHRLLKPGGTLCATTYGWMNMQELYSLVASVKKVHFGDPVFDPQNLPRRFALENGQIMLEQVFGGADIRIYPAHLRVTEAEPLMAYIRTVWQLTAEEEAALQARIEREIQVNGYYFIGKSQGMLLAQKQIP